VRRPVWLFVLSAALLVTAGPARAKEVARDAYLKQVPLSHPRLVRQTDASDALHLYGDREDPAYRDVDPVDGIDDRRHEVLLSLAVRFAPYLVQNTTNIPTNFDIYIDNRSSFPLYVDTWDVSAPEPKLVGSEGINFSVLGSAACGDTLPRRAREEHPLPTTDGAIEDCKLVELMSRLSPVGTESKTLEEMLVRKRPELFEVVFFDFPGEDARSWEEGYEPEYEKTREAIRPSFPHAYVHPFIVTVTDDGGSLLGYELVLQYWFFYPSNDSGMNHEGDWEHMNVVLAPRSMVAAPMSAQTIDRILTGALPTAADAADPLVIRRVDYYFHHLVMTLDFSIPNVYQSRDQWKAEVKRLPTTRVQENEIWEHIRHMAYVDEKETVINTHPFGYIGADNKGFDQALAAPGGKNRNPHGTYPFPGRYQNVGPGGTTDQVSVHVDPRKYWKRLQAGKATTGPEFKRGRVLGLADPQRLRIVPDWERVVDHAREDAQARRDWSWLILPIHWGYPVTESPFAGILEHFDTGNVAPVGPSYNSGWNVSGPSPGFQAYEPHILPSVFPVGLQDSFRNDLGFFNLTLPVLFNLPPLDFLTRLGTYPFKLALGNRDPMYYPKESVPFRFVGLSSGISMQIFDENFDALALNPGQYDEWIFQVVFHLLTSGSDSTTAVVGGEESKTNSVGPFLQVAFYIGGRFTSENTVRNARSSFGVTVDFNNIPSYTYSAEINYWEYAGSLRYSLTTSRLQPFVKGGYGWSWYQLENVRANGELFTTPESGWIKPKNIWPNVWHFGAGVEFVPWKRVGKLPGGVDVAFRVEYGRYFQGLGLDLSGISLERLGLLFDTLGEVPTGDTVVRDDFVFGMTVSF